MKLDITAKGEYGVAYFENSSIRTTTIGNTVYYNYIDLLDNFGLANTKKLLADLGTECKIIKMLNKNNNPAPMRAVTVKGLQKVWAYAASGEAEMKRSKAKKEEEEDSTQAVTEKVNTSTEGETKVLSNTEKEPVQEEAVPKTNDPVEETASPVAGEAGEPIQVDTDVNKMSVSTEPEVIVAESPETSPNVQEEEADKSDGSDETLNADTPNLPTEEIDDQKAEEGALAKEKSVQEEAVPETNDPVEETATPVTEEVEEPISITDTPDSFMAEVSDEACDFAEIKAIAQANPDPEQPLTDPNEVTEVQLRNRQRIQEARAKRKALEARKAELDQAIADGNIEEDFRDFADAPYVQEVEENTQGENVQGEGETGEENNDPDGKGNMLSAPWSPSPKEEEYPDPIDHLSELEDETENESSAEEDVIHLNTDPVSEEDESSDDSNLKADEPQSREEVFKWINLMDTAIVEGSQVKLIMRQARRSRVWMVFVNEEWWIPARSICTIVASFHGNTELHEELIYMCGEEKPASYLPLSMQMIQKKSQLSRLRLMVYKGLWWVSVKDTRRWLDKYPDYPLMEELKAELMDWTSLPYRKQAIIDMLRETCDTYLATHEDGSDSSVYNTFLRSLGLSCDVVGRCGRQVNHNPAN